MTGLYNQNAQKKPTNVTINSDLLNKSRELGVNLSATLEQALVVVVRQRQREEWVKQNQVAITAYNNEVDKHGVFSDGLRSF